jgi:transposase
VNETRYIGIDVGKRRCQACIIDDERSVREEFNFNNTSDGIRNLLDRASSTQCRAVLESTGNLWIRLYEALESHGVEVKLANPNKTKAIASAKIKTDKLSARILAHLLRADLIAECHVPPRDVRLVRSLLRQRESLVKIQTMVKNQVHALLDKHGFKSAWSDTFGVHGMEWLRNLQLDPVDRCILDTHIRHLECLKDQLSLLDSKIASHAIRSEDAKLLMTFTGINYHGALVVAKEINDIRRFPSPKQFISWIGLCPSLHQSGNSLYMGRMKKDSNKRVRRILIEAARVASKRDPRMTQLYERAASRSGENKAIVKVANKMATIIWHMLTKTATLPSDEARALPVKT